MTLYDVIQHSVDDKHNINNTLQNNINLCYVLGEI